MFAVCHCLQTTQRTLTCYLCWLSEAEKSLSAWLDEGHRLVESPFIQAKMCFQHVADFLKVVMSDFVTVTLKPVHNLLRHARDKCPLVEFVSPQIG